MLTENLAVCIEALAARCPLWKDEDLHLFIIANPHAGGFTRPKQIAFHNKVFSEFLEAALTKEQVCRTITREVFETSYAGEGGVIARQIAAKALQQPSHQYLIVTAGGDGTSLEVQTALVRLILGDEAEKFKPLITTHFCVLRLPFGTGNDGSDGRTLPVSLSLLSESSKFFIQKAVRVSYARNLDEQTIAKEGKKIKHYDSLDNDPPWYAFNIASIGIDAYITHMTNHTKNLFPGNFYKLWIDLACLFYAAQFPPGIARIQAYDKQDKLLHTIEKKILFCLLGASGKRTYGSGQKILPDDRNSCVAFDMSNLAKLMIKERFKNGTHADLADKCKVFDAHKLVIDYPEDILVQMDGEVHLLHKNNFPLTIELTEPLIRVIKAL